jgi:hypothetical protein
VLPRAKTCRFSRSAHHAHPSRNRRTVQGKNEWRKCVNRYRSPPGQNQASAVRRAQRRPRDSAAGGGYSALRGSPVFTSRFGLLAANARTGLLPRPISAALVGAPSPADGDRARRSPPPRGFPGLARGPRARPRHRCPRESAGADPPPFPDRDRAGPERRQVRLRPEPPASRSERRGRAPAHPPAPSRRACREQPTRVASGPPRTALDPPSDLARRGVGAEMEVAFSSHRGGVPCSSAEDSKCHRRRHSSIAATSDTERPHHPFGPHR